MSWKTLGSAAPGDLVDARLQLHHAAQVVAAAGITWLEPQPDDSHPNLGWLERAGALIGRRLPGAEVQVGLRPGDLSLLLADASGEPRDIFSLEGRTLEDAYAWLEATTTRAGLALPAGGVTRSTYEIPPHPVGEGRPFPDEGREARAELGHWFSNGQQILSRLAAGTGASEVRCWPHHFDLGALQVVATNADGSLAKSVGIGMSPGDDSYAEPYFYVSPWPYPEAEQLPPLPGGGHWHTEGFAAAILTGSELLDGAASRQEDAARRFLEDAVGTSLQILER